jgi:hypothetical protein
MNELRRMAYLDAMGIDSYVSRGQLPGAAPTRRLAVVPVRPEPAARPAPPVSESAVAHAPAEAGEHLAQAQAALRTAAPITQPGEAGPGESPAAPRPAAEAMQSTPPRFNIAAVVANGYLWVEEIADRPLATEQVQLVQAMARALARVVDPDGAAAADARPDVAMFKWPMHNNRQLDLGVEAARSGVAAFIGRRLEEQRCRGLVLLGATSRRWVPLEQFSLPSLATSAGTLEMLTDPLLKKQVWADLQGLTRGG